MIIALMGGGVIHVTESTAHKIDAIIEEKPDAKTIKFKTENGTDQRLTLSSITGIWEDEAWDTMQREKRGEFKCAEDKWHKKGEVCTHGFEKDELPGPAAKPLPRRKQTMVLNKENRVVGRYDTFEADGRTYAKRPDWVKAGKLPGGQEPMI